MKPYGLRNKFHYNYTDCHPKKDHTVNWWEVELNDVKSKKSERQKMKINLNRLFSYYEYDGWTLDICPKCGSSEFCWEDNSASKLVCCECNTPIEFPKELKELYTERNTVIKKIF